MAISRGFSRGPSTSRRSRRRHLRTSDLGLLMKIRRYHSVGLAALSSALVLLSGDVVSAASSTSPLICAIGTVSDGHCDEVNNNDDCGYDGGDCCGCTCVSTDDNNCGENGGFACVDPSADCVDDGGDTTTTPSDIQDGSDAQEAVVSCLEDYLSDGDCDPRNNKEECGYDGGDCCECTCISSGNYTCGSDHHGGYACLDPSAPCVDDDDITVLPEYEYTSTAESDITTCFDIVLADGDCDPINNNEECGYDGGDCCVCTCVSTAAYRCGSEHHGGYACLDPTAPCVDDDDVTALPEWEHSSYSGRPSSLCFESGIGDGDCDPSNNNEDCDYDGGDCCQCTCVSTVDYNCGDDFHGGYACVDPSAPCVDDDDVTSVPEYRYIPYSERTTTSSTCFGAVMSDGDCDPNNNNEECGYDGGDCCQCTCVSSEDYTCGDDHHGGYACLDPSAPCVDDDDITTLPEFNYGTYSGSWTNTCYIFAISDGDCDPTNNNEECGYDGGDCCQCTCVSTEEYTCGDEFHGGYACLDPAASCVDDDDITTLPEFEYVTYSGGTSSACFDSVVADGDCDPANNHEACGYDGGDCCECTCISALYTCGNDLHGGYSCADPNASCFDGYVEAGNKTNISVSANAYDTRPGEASGDIGCGADGCAPALARDGISADTESRWSCAQTIVPGGGPCEIEFRFETIQDIKDVEVAFWRGDERSRTLEVMINGVVVGEFESDPGSTFTELGIEGVGVHTLKLKAVDVADNGWIALLEVRFMVEP